MKKIYMKPELGTKQYAQFENVFTGCSKSNSKAGCAFNANVTESGYDTVLHIQYDPSNWNHHNNLAGSIS